MTVVAVPRVSSPALPQQNTAAPSRTSFKVSSALSMHPPVAVAGGVTPEKLIPSLQRNCDRSVLGWRRDLDMKTQQKIIVMHRASVNSLSNFEAWKTTCSTRYAHFVFLTELLSEVARRRNCQRADPDSLCQKVCELGASVIRRMSTAKDDPYFECLKDIAALYPHNRGLTSGTSPLVD